MNLHWLHKVNGSSKLKSKQGLNDEGADWGTHCQFWGKMIVFRCLWCLSPSWRTEKVMRQWQSKPGDEDFFQCFPVDGRGVPVDGRPTFGD